MMNNAQDYLVERRTDENFEGVKQKAETLIAEIEQLFPEIERVVGSADFGRDAIAKARTTRRAQPGPRSLPKITALVKEQVDQLSRTQRMFKGVIFARLRSTAEVSSRDSMSMNESSPQQEAGLRSRCRSRSRAPNTSWDSPTRTRKRNSRAWRS